MRCKRPLNWSSTAPLPDVFNRLVELGCELLNAAAGHAWLREGDHLILQASKGPRAAGRYFRSIPA